MGLVTVFVADDKSIVNPLKPSGAKWLHLKASRTILV